jgi:threonine/homoserine/homoserine lactone efflux protein
MAALGINAGCALHALAAAFGLAAVLAWSATAFALVKWAGAAYLLWLGIGMLRAAWRGAAPTDASLAAAPRDVPDATGGADFRRGLLTNLLNPKVALFMLAFLPQFIPAQLPHKTLAFLALAALFIVQSLLFLGVVVVLPAARAGCRPQADCSSSRSPHGWPTLASRPGAEPGPALD